MADEAGFPEESADARAGDERGYSARFLLLLVAPALTYLIIAAIDHSIWQLWLDLDRLREIPVPMPGEDWRLPAGLVAATYLYAIVFGVLVMVVAPTLAFTVWLMSRPELPGGRLALLLAGLYALGYLIYSLVIWGQYSAVEANLVVAQVLSGLESGWAGVTLGGIVGGVNSLTRILAFTTLLFLVFAAPCCVSVPRGGAALDAEALARRKGWLTILLYLGAAALVVGMLSTGALYQIPLPLIPQGEALTLAQELGRARQLFTGFAMAALLASIYLPPAIILRAEAAARAKRLAHEGKIDNSRAWLEAQGLGGTAVDGVVKMLVLLAPLITALVGPSLGVLKGG